VRTGAEGGADVGKQRLTLQEAAHALGVSESAIRKRVKRGTLEHEKTEGGRVLVYLDTGSAPVADTEPPPESDALISAKDETIATLREQLASERQALEAERDAHAESRRLLLQALQKIPDAIEPPQEPPQEPSEAPETAREQPGRVGAQPSLEERQRAPQRPTWREEAQGTLREVPGILRDARGAWRRFLQR
jgi:excisionase family DNA binding protein